MNDGTKTLNDLLDTLGGCTARVHTPGYYPGESTTRIIHEVFGVMVFQQTRNGKLLVTAVNHPTLEELKKLRDRAVVSAELVFTYAVLAKMAGVSGFVNPPPTPTIEP